MKKLLIIAFVGFFAQLIDGSLGMGFGVTSSSILLTLGLTPAIVSATIHFSEIATTAASGISHMSFANADKKLILRLAVPGSMFAFISAALVSHLHANIVKPAVALFLISIGIYILYQFAFKGKRSYTDGPPPSNKLLIPLSSVAGFLTAIGGGGWGPVNTSVLVSRRNANVRHVIGSVSVSEFFVTIAASVSFLIFLRLDQINWGLVAALSIGGVAAAPFAAWMVKVIPVEVLGIFVGGLIIFTNSNTLMNAFGADASMATIVRITVVVAWLGLLLYTLNKAGKLPNFFQKKQTHKVGKN
ncbi:sulfite exporter TauE/SafE family protein [Staphylococcus carnosus]|uniref:Probable membrane transporter protein n=1 Tax=Staphylococcus carnosus TaxID=1281 RepID=A0AAJ0JMP5_STACA|nr:sulfite exporter TauE/SafE family protein [Staphylococcus carnosus]KKB24602.1 membrane protein [Staphylococcus carnosus]QQS86226.1 sulfite exporter TauE/SafE family protein [Staphylococcus carnosus]UTC01509.1 hypothetical protein A7E59_12475 [Staphylococcus carnosus]UTC01704.1 hypothetical protein A2I68_00310 [Staphylococcus carnosus]